MANNSTSITMEMQALNSLASQSTANLCWMIFGFFGIAFNSLTLLTIIKTKVLHNKSHYLIFSHAVAEIIFAMCMFVIGTRRYFLYIFRDPGIGTQLACTLSNLTINMSLQAVVNWILALGIDRMMAIFAPIFYRSCRLGRHLIFFNILCYAPLSVNLISAILTMSSTPWALIPTCVRATAAPQSFQRLWNIINIVLMAITISIYLICMAKAAYGFWGKKWLNESQRAQWSRDVQLGAFKSILAIAVSHVLCQGAVMVINSIQTSDVIALAILTNILPYLSMVNFLEIIPHFFIYMCTNKKFRKGFLMIINRENGNYITPLTTITVKGSNSVITVKSRNETSKM